jgi:parvulin-like peptidyl-prolyl isomerase
MTKRAVAALCAGVLWLPLLAADVELVEEIIAKVNGDIITRSEIQKMKQALRADLAKAGKKGPELDAEVEERSKSFLRDKIDNLLLIQKAKEVNINVDGDVGRQLNDIMKQYKITDTEALAKLVREQTGMPFEDYKNEMKNQMLTQRVIRQEVGGRINIPKAELREYYERHKDEFQREERIFLRELLVGTAGKDAAGVEAARKKAADLVARARKGERFHELVRDNSDAASVNEEGFIGAFKKGDLRKELEDILWAQQKNYVTDPIKIDSGFLILKIEEKHQAGLATYEEVEGEIQEKLYMARFQPRIREYLTQLRQDAFLELKEGWVDASPAPGKDTRWSDPAQLKPETVTKEEVAAVRRLRRLFWLVPVPGTNVTPPLEPAGEDEKK